MEINLPDSVIAENLALKQQQARLLQELAALRQQVSKPQHVDPPATNRSSRERKMIGQSPAIRDVLKQVDIVAPSSCAVLVLGETGTGKELIARAIHHRSPRRAGAIATINCVALPAGLLESELFGHEKGAFTGAIARKPGRFELAHGSTLFLDEVGDIPLELQPKLLRVLQEQEFERVGGTQTLRMNVRVVAATSRDLSRMVADRQFRDDLYFRLNVFPIRVPPLRERRDDIPLLVQHFVKDLSARLDKQIETVPPEVMAALCRHSWPGNVRELENFLERAVIMSPGPVLAAPVAELERRDFSPSPSGGAKGITLQECERERILEALFETAWTVGGPGGAASLLGLKRTTLISKMQKLGIHRRNCAGVDLQSHVVCKE